jgi:hypothetical protein
MNRYGQRITVEEYNNLTFSPDYNRYISLSIGYGRALPIIVDAISSGAPPPWTHLARRGYHNVVPPLFINMLVGAKFKLSHNTIVHTNS